MGYPEYYNVSLQNLLCILNNEPYYDILKTFFSNGGGGLRTNAYYTLFPQILNMNYRFLPDFFTNSNGLKISYLVSRLDGLTYADVRNSIYNSFNSDKTGLRTWIIDGYSQLGYVPPSAAKHLQDLGFQVNCNFDEEYILDNHLYNNNEVIGYTSFGTNGGMAPDYIQSSLTFNYAPGAVFNTFESFNGTGIGSLVRRADQGLFTEFIKMGGTAGVCYPWEPVTGWWTTDLVSDITFLPAYAIGYTLVDAIYMDMNNIVFQTVVVGVHLQLLPNILRLS